MEEAWKRFARSGLVSDYLSYVSANRVSQDEEQPKASSGVSAENEKERTSGGTDGRIEESDGNRSLVAERWGV